MLKDEVAIKIPTWFNYSSPARITPLSFEILENRVGIRLAANVPTNIERNPPLSSFATFLSVSLTSFIKKKQNHQKI